MNPIDQLMNEGISSGIFPSATLLFAKGDEILHRAAYGAATVETLYDIASLTKVLPTTAIAMRLYEQGRLELDQPLAEIVKAFSGGPYATATIRQLLAHKSGLPAYRPFFEQFDPEKLSTENLVERRDQYLAWIAQLEPEGKLGEKYIYSDLDFIILGAILESKSACDLASLLKAEVSTPLGLRATRYGPVDNSKENVAPTEENSWRRRILCGEVHDENAYVLGGVAGHAGVFTSLEDCHKFAREFVRAVRGDSSWLKAETIKAFVGSECLGWDRPSRPQSQAGQFFPTNAIGHLGFTGCSMWIDLDREVIAILLTNRIHPNRANETIKEFRPKIHDALFQHYLS